MNAAHFHFTSSVYCITASCYNKLLPSTHTRAVLSMIETFPLNHKTYYKLRVHLSSITGINSGTGIVLVI